MKNDNFYISSPMKMTIIDLSQIYIKNKLRNIPLYYKEREVFDIIGYQR